MPQPIEVIATLLFAVAVLHAVLRAAGAQGWPHAGFWHLFAEVEAVFGVGLRAHLRHGGAVRPPAAIEYMDTRNFTEPLFVFVIMVVAASRPILELVGQLVRLTARVLRCAASWPRSS